MNALGTPRRTPSIQLFGYDLFISFALGPPPRGSRNYASDLARKLRERDFTVFFSEDEAPAGGELDQTLKRALSRAGVLVVIANQATLEDPRWVRLEVEEFRQRHPRRLVVPISIDGALHDPLLATATESWLGFRSRIWIDETRGAAESGVVSDEVVQRLVTAPTSVRAAVRWRWLIGVVSFFLIGLAAAASYSAWRAAQAAAAELKAANEARAAEGHALEAATREAQAASAARASEQRASEAAVKEAEAASDAREQASRAEVAEGDTRMALRTTQAEQSRAVASLALQVIERGDAATGMLAALSVLPRHAERPWSVEAEAALLQGYVADREEATLIGHTALVWWVAFAPGSRRLLSASEDGTVREWDLESATQQSKVLIKRNAAIRQATVSADGKTLVAAAEDGTLWLLLLDAPGTEPVPLVGHAGKVISMDLSNDGTRLLTASEDGSARIWDLQGMKIESHSLEGHRDPVHLMRFGPDSRRWVTASEGAIRLWNSEADMSTSSLLAEPRARSYSAAYSPDGALLLVATRDKPLAMWRLLLPGLPVTTLDDHAKWVWKISFDRSSKHLATTSADMTTRLWAWDGRHATSQVIERYANWQFTPTFSPDGTELLVASGPRSVRLWSLALRPEAPILSFEVVGGISSAAFSADSRRIALGAGDGTVRVLRIGRAGLGQSILPAQSGSAMDAVWSPDGKAFAVYHRNEPRVQLWQLKAAQWKARLLQGHSAGVEHAAFNHDGTLLATASRDGSARLWEVDPNGPPRVLTGHRYGLTRVAFSPDGQLVATASLDSTARVWSVSGNSRDPIVLDEHIEQLFFVGFTRDGRLITASHDRTARIWPLSSLSGNFSPVVLDARRPKAKLSTGNHRAAISEDGQWLALTFDSPLVELWNLRAGRPTPVVLSGARDLITHLAFSKDSRRLTAASTGVAFVWDLGMPAKKPLVLEAHSQQVNKAEFSPDGRRLVTAANDRTVRVWQLDAKAPTSMSLEGFADRDTFAHFDASGEHLLTGPQHDGALALWELPSAAKLVAMAGKRLTRCLTSAQRDDLGLSPTSPASAAHGRYEVRRPPC